MRKIRSAVAAVATIAGLIIPAVVTTGAVGAVAPYCGITWGSLAKADSRMTTASIVGLRAGRHACFDRLVVDLRDGPAPGWSVGYVNQVVEDGSGRPIPLRGGAFLHVAVHAPAHDPAYGPTYRPADPAEAVNVAAFGTFRQVAFAGTFEGITTFGLGVRARLPFRVFIVAGPGSATRLVIDVAHRWS